MGLWQGPSPFVTWREPKACWGMWPREGGPRAHLPAGGPRAHIAGDQGGGLPQALALLLAPRQRAGPGGDQEALGVVLAAAPSQPVARLRLPGTAELADEALGHHLVEALPVLPGDEDPGERQGKGPASGDGRRARGSPPGAGGTLGEDGADSGEWPSRAGSLWDGLGQKKIPRAQHRSPGGGRLGASSFRVT